MDDRPQESSPSEKSSDLIVSDDSLYVTDSVVEQVGQSPENSPKLSETEQKSSVATGLSSNDLIPHPSTNDAVTVSRFPERGISASQSEKTIAESVTEAVQLTAEIFASGAIPAGTMLGHFMIKSYIGGGGMGRVYLANDTALDRNVAVKVLPRQRANDQSTVARFMNEAKSAARLNHEHIAQVYFAGEQDGIPFIVFEYVEGTNIRSMVDDYDAFPLPQALNYLIQIAHALAHAADHGVVHRDVKPSNILITREGRAKLIDMGLARLLDPSETKDDLTASGVTLGTFDYISPEQARDPRNADIRSDIYSLGCTFFFMLAGRPPFPEGTVLQKLLQHQGDEPPDIRSFQPTIPSEVAVLMQKMMAKDPRQRFQTPSALIDALVHVAKMIGLQPTGPGKLNWVMSTPSQSSQFLKHLPWIAAISLLLGTYFLVNLYWQQVGKPSNIIPPDLISQFQKEDSSLTTTSLDDPEKLETTNPAMEAKKFAQTKPTATYNLIALSPKQFDGELHLRFPSFFDNRSDKELSTNPKRRTRFLGSDRLGNGISAPSLSGHLAKQSYSGSLGLLPYLKDAKTPSPVILPSTPSEAGKILSVCVDPSGETANSYKNLAAALAKADKGATIELKWNDVQKIDPFALTGRQLHFIASEGYRPIMKFEPSGFLAASQSSRTMITVRSCYLIFQNIGIEMGIQQDDMGLQWTLFELIEANDIRFQGCTLTIRNAATDNSAYHQQVAFFRNSPFSAGLEQIPLISSAERSDSIQFDAEYEPPYEPIYADSGQEFSSSVSAIENSKERLKIQMIDSILRGEATGFCCDTLQDTEIIARNCMFALAKSFVRLEDSGRTSPSEAKVRIEFDQVSFFGLQSFARQFRNSFETEPIRLEVEATRSIFFLSNTPLAVFRGASSRWSAFDYLKWTGRDYYFQDVSQGWKFQTDATRPDGGIAYDMPLSEWIDVMNPSSQRELEQLPRIDQLSFEENRKPMHLLLWRDLRPVFLPDSTLSEEEKRSIGASQPMFSTSGASNETGANPDRRPIQSDFGRLRFE